MKKLLILLAPVFFLSACNPDTSVTGVGSRSNDINVLEENQAKLVTAVPAPMLQNSLERLNISQRLRRLNAQNMNGYIYLINYGKIMAYYQVKGKVSSLNSYLTPQERLWWGSNGAVIATATPDLDGSYGYNSDGIFFFTTNNAYVEWHGDYLFADQPLSLQETPTLIQEL